MLLGGLLYGVLVAGPKRALLAARSAFRIAHSPEGPEQLERRLLQASNQRERELQSVDPALTVPQLLDALTKDLDALGLQERRWNIGNPVRSSEIVDTPVSLTFHGSFPALAQLLERIECYPGRVRVAKVDARRRATGPDDVLAATVDIINSVAATQFDEREKE
jgi:hypothetical protein